MGFYFTQVMSNNTDNLFLAGGVWTMAALFKSKKKKKEVEEKFPDTLLGFGYEFSKGNKRKRKKTWK